MTFEISILIQIPEKQLSAFGSNVIKGIHEYEIDFHTEIRVDVFLLKNSTLL